MHGTNLINGVLLHVMEVMAMVSKNGLPLERIRGILIILHKHVG